MPPRLHHHEDWNNKLCTVHCHCPYHCPPPPPRPLPPLLQLVSCKTKKHICKIARFTGPPVTIPSTGGFFASPNYPKNYTVLEKRTWTFQCPFSNQSAGIFILDLCLGSGDSLIVQNSRTDGPEQMSLPLPMMFANRRGISVTFNSDARSTCTGFRIAAGCYRK